MNVRKRVQIKVAGFGWKMCVIVTNVRGMKAAI